MASVFGATTSSDFHLNHFQFLFLDLVDHVDCFMSFYLCNELINDFSAKKWNSIELLSRKGNKLHYAMHYSHILVFAIPTSTFYDSIVLITIVLVRMTFIVHVIITPNCM